MDTAGETLRRRTRHRAAATVAATVAGALAASVLAAPPPAGGTPPLPRPPAAVPADPRAAADLFAMPAVAAGTRTAFALAAAGETAGAAAMLDRLVMRHPDLGAPRAGRAVLAMLEGRPETAVADLEAAARSDPATAALVDDPLFAPALADPRLGPRLAALRALPAPPAAPVPRALPLAGGGAPVTAGNTVWDPTSERLVAHFAVLPDARAPVLPAGRKTAADELLREHVRRGRAAGNHGDLYDNRDRGHSALRPDAHPQLAHVSYAPPARAAELDYGLNDALFFGRPTLGNSSTALTGGPYWRSLPRHAMTRPDGTGPLRLWQNARAGQIYVFPAHKDFTDEAGDLFPANTPYLLVSRGSSGSDRPFLEAIAMILAAFRPDTKARLVDSGLVVPTVQMVFRRSLQDVRSREAYFSGAAHPAVFDGQRINLARMVSLANAITPADIPAEARIRVIGEDTGREGTDFFGQGLSEQLFDTPGAVARIWRSGAWRRTMTVSAEDSFDANGRPLAFHWRLLQGDPDRVRITPLAGGAQARITLDWHDPFPISEETPLTTARVDIGVFADNGAHDSAPAILSWVFPAHQTRRWEPGPDGVPRIAAIAHADPEKADIYTDPLLFPRADWRDEYAWAPDGTPAGWTRIREAGRADFTAGGSRRLPGGGEAAVAHVIAPGPDGRLEIAERPAP